MSDVQGVKTGAERLEEKKTKDAANRKRSKEHRALLNVVAAYVSTVKTETLESGIKELKKNKIPSGEADDYLRHLNRVISFFNFNKVLFLNDILTDSWERNPCQFFFNSRKVGCFNYGRVDIISYTKQKQS